MKAFILLVALLASGSAAGQASRLAGQPSALASQAPPAAPDTAAALHRLFAARRQRRNVLLLGTAAAEVAGQVVVSNTVPAGGIIDSQAIDRFLVALLAVPVVAGEVLFFNRYNEQHERRALADWEAHRLSRYLKRRLRARHFVQ